MMDLEGLNPDLTIKDIFRYILAYLLWVLTAVTGMFAMLQFRNLLNIAWPMLGGNRWVLRPVDRFALIGMGLLWLAYNIFLENHYRSAVTYFRVVRYKKKMGYSLPPVPESPQNSIMQWLAKRGMALLIRRFALTFVVPLGLLVLAYVLLWLVNVVAM